MLSLQAYGGIAVSTFCCKEPNVPIEAIIKVGKASPNGFDCMVTFSVTARSGSTFSEERKNRWTAKANNSVPFTTRDLFFLCAPQMDFPDLFFGYGFSTFLRHYLYMYSYGTSPNSINITVQLKSIEVGLALPVNGITQDSIHLSALHFSLELWLFSKPPLYHGGKHFLHFALNQNILYTGLSAHCRTTSVTLDSNALGANDN